MNKITLSDKSKNSVITKTLSVLQNGGLVVFPSDTVYGLLVDATNLQAVNTLISFKNRPPGKAISVFVANLEMMKKYTELSKGNIQLLQNLLPGPFTVVVASKHNVSQMLEAENGTLGLRIPDFPLVIDLVDQFGKPITATSANLGGRSPHYSIESLLNQLPESKKKLIDLIVDAGKLPHNKPSTVIDLTKETIKTLREGDILVKDSKTYESTSSEQTQKVGAYLLDKLITNEKGKPIVIILQGELGAGKTQMAKGMADLFEIDNIISPTFVVYYEYEIDQNSNKLQDLNYKNFVHVDLYNIQEKEEFEHLGLENYLSDGNIMVIEWGEKLGELYDLFQQKARVVHVNIEYESETKRKIIISI